MYVTLISLFNGRISIGARGCRATGGELAPFRLPADLAYRAQLSGRLRIFLQASEHVAEPLLLD
jgi:hypothetical protein